MDLTGTTSYEQVIARVVERARTTPRGEWILGRGWDQNDWGSTNFPTHEALSRAVPDHPVMLTRVDGHAILANASAMRAANVTRESQAPAGGAIERDANGNPSGVFVDNPASLRIQEKLGFRPVGRNWKRSLARGAAVEHTDTVLTPARFRQAMR